MWQGELSFLGDELIEGGTKGEMTNGKSYAEVRQCLHPFYLLRFYFVTRVYSAYMETVIADLVSDHKPDIVVINSCLWDITRYRWKWYIVFSDVYFFVFLFVSSITRKWFQWYAQGPSLNWPQRWRPRWYGLVWSGMVWYGMVCLGVRYAGGDTSCGVSGVV